MKWIPEKIDFMVDNRIFNTFTNEHKTIAEWPFDQYFHLQLNIAVGGAWGGRKGIENIFSQKMWIDFIRRNEHE